MNKEEILKIYTDYLAKSNTVDGLEDGKGGICGWCVFSNLLDRRNDRLSVYIFPSAGVYVVEDDGYTISDLSLLYGGDEGKLSQEQISKIKSAISGFGCVEVTGGNQDVMSCVATKKQLGEHIDFLFQAMHVVSRMEL